jgi:hypothetical protein
LNNINSNTNGIMWLKSSANYEFKNLLFL